MSDIAVLRAALARSNAKNEQLVTERDDALRHLGDVLSVLADLEPEERCRALDEALSFYNEACPDMQVHSEPGFTSRLVISSPVEAAARENVLEKAAFLAGLSEPQTLRLHMGELSAQEMRSCQALLGFIQARLCLPTV